MHDCAKGIATGCDQWGKITDYEGVDKSTRPQLPLMAINTTAGTASEMTRFCIITDETRQVKMVIVDKHTTPILSVNDPQMMTEMPLGLTAATGMGALTHAIEAYVSTMATPITDACALKAIELISSNLRAAVKMGRICTPANKWHTPNFWRAWHLTMPRLGMRMPWRINSAVL